MKHPLPALLAALSLALIPAGVLAAQESEPAPVEALPERAPPTLVEGAARDALLVEISAALGSVETAKGRFRQYNADFTEDAGDFYIRRPGRVRFDYDAPSALSIIADGTTVAIEDTELETQDRVPLASTPLAAIIDDDIDLIEKVTVLSVERADDYIAVVSEDKTGEIAGQLIMVFDAEDYGLLQWRTIDENAVATTVELSAVETGVSINPRLFRIEELGEDDERD